MGESYGTKKATIQKVGPAPYLTHVGDNKYTLHFDGVLIGQGTTTEHDDDVVKVAGWEFSGAVTSWEFPDNEPPNLCGYTMAELQQIAATELTAAQLAHIDTLGCPFELHLNPPHIDTTA